jgi:hypothetical protein
MWTKEKKRMFVDWVTGKQADKHSAEATRNGVHSRQDRFVFFLFFVFFFADFSIKSLLEAWGQCYNHIFGDFLKK